MPSYINSIIIIFTSILVIEFISINFYLIKDTLSKSYSSTNQVLIFNVIFSSLYLFIETRLFSYIGIFLVVITELIILKKQKKEINYGFLKDKRFILTILISLTIITNCIISYFDFDLKMQLRFIALHLLCIFYFVLKNIKSELSIINFQTQRNFCLIIFFLIFQYFILFLLLSFKFEDFSGSLNFNTSWQNFMQYQDILYPSLSFLSITIFILILLILKSENPLLLISIGILILILDYNSVRIGSAIFILSILLLFIFRFKTFPHLFFYISLGYLIAVIMFYVFSNTTKNNGGDEFVKSYVDLRSDITEFKEVIKINKEIKLLRINVNDNDKDSKILKNDPSRIIYLDSIKNYLKKKYYLKYFFGNGVQSHKIEIVKYLPSTNYYRNDLTVFDEYIRLVLKNDLKNPWDLNLKKQLSSNYENPIIINGKKVIKIKSSKSGATIGLPSTFFDNGLFFLIIVISLFVLNMMKENRKIMYFMFSIPIFIIILILPNYEHLFVILFFSNLRLIHD